MGVYVWTKEGKIIITGMGFEEMELDGLTQRESMDGDGAWGEALSSNCLLGRIPMLHCCITNHYKTQRLTVYYYHLS